MRAADGAPSHVFFRGGSPRSLPDLVVLAHLIPALTYVLLSWVWLIARIVDLLGGTPRGGHPVTHER